ncbi:MAG: DUF1178 family protein [Sphingomonas sp.]|uniref:DUF1178 family protein n=1 Tax=Sphingomonas sp. CD22 TaxID=3100214 RepID=UPI001217A444|nr:DUF1178 family protein [Sphingomonas sp. CD22]MEA1084265.1 DUF1178 family protein [Sphingomonas sp. CD22]RZL59284.1 MAG: DUF1178 family protein [Sphingomonas sp.]
MIVFDLRCGLDHVFEAWFASSAAYDAQAAAGLLACPMCGDTAVAKALMAPSIPAKGNRRADLPPAAAIKAALREIAADQARTLATSSWVGGDFATRARAMHDGDEVVRPIHGQASLAEAKALVADGVPVAPLLCPVVPPEKTN